MSGEGNGGAGGGTGEGTGTGTGTGEGQQGQGSSAVEGAASLGWRAGLPKEYQDHELVKGHARPGDFMSWVVGVKGELDDAKGKLETAIFRPGEGAEEGEVAAFREALGVPKEAKEYEFPAVEGVSNDERMVSWAQGVFHKAGLTKEQAGLIGGEWNAFVKGMSDTEEERAEEARKKAEDVLKKELGTEDKYKEGVELVSRLLREVALDEELEWLQESGNGNHPLLIRLILRMAQKTGEDGSPPGSKKGEGKQKAGFQYNKSPEPPKHVY